MADISDIEAAETVKIVGSQADGTEQTPVRSTTLADLQVADVPNQAGVSGVLNLTTTAIEGKVNALPLENRKFVEMQALTKRVKWGYDPSCPFDLFKNQFFALPVGENCTIYFKADSGTADVAFSEK